MLLSATPTITDEAVSFILFYSFVQHVLYSYNKNSEGDFLALESLNAVVEQLPKTRIGDEMRSYFKQAFTELLKYDEIDEILSMEAFWRS